MKSLFSNPMCMLGLLATVPFALAGCSGEDGETGAQGPVGLTGEQGAVGAAGPAGADGQDGVDGTTGTDGTDGTDGQDGQDGQDGTDGTQGIQGEQGIQGPAGPAGTDGTWVSPKAKYVFLFIGDGMASVQIHAAEAYLANKVARDEVGGSAKAVLLNLTGLPVQGMASTFPYNSLITDSAPAATAIATGKKTGDGVIAMDPTKTLDYETVAEVAKSAGMKIGIVSSVSIDHATPAAFYAHEPSRNNYHYIGHDLVASNFDYFGGGGFVDPLGTRQGVTPKGDVVAAAASAGYAVADSRAEFEALIPGTKAIAINPVLDSSKALYYDIDRVYANDASSHISLAEFTEKGVELLYTGNDTGFFMMVEGGKIDWSCHANDARTTIDDTLAFDDAVKVALDFMKLHPNETLIVVTGDHETGGMTIGWAGTAYASHFEKLEAQKLSYQEFDKIIAAFKAANGNGSTAPASFGSTTLAADMLSLFGLDYSTLSAFDKERMDAAYAKAMTGASTKTAEEDSLLYGTYNPLSVTITHVLNNRAGIGWTSYSHTAVPVPVLAAGAGSEKFGGFYDNTDIATKLASAMRVMLSN
jgi:alkaline phosphatase